MKPIREILFLILLTLQMLAASKLIAQGQGQGPLPRIEFVTVLEGTESRDSLNALDEIEVMLRIRLLQPCENITMVRLSSYPDGNPIATWDYDVFPNPIKIWDADARANVGQLFYYVDFIDSDGDSAGRSSDVHGTVFLKELSLVSPCDASIELSWIPYTVLLPPGELPGAQPEDPVQILAYNLLVTRPDGSLYEAEVQPNENTFTFSGLDIPGDYRFRIRVRFRFGDGSEQISYSNSRTMTYVAPPSIDRMEIEKVDVLPGGGIEISWDFQTIDASAFDLFLQRADSFSGDYSDISGPLSGVSLFEDTDADPNDGPWYYRLRATFSGPTQCPDTLSSPLSSIFLSHQSGAGGTVVLSWEHFVPGNSPVSYMVLISADNGNNYDDWSGPTSTNEVVIYPGDLNPGQWFFKIRANLNNQVMHSNVVVLMVAPDIRIPNAFRPDSDNPLNRVFKPDFYGFNPLAYSMRIINRWGQLVFETNDHQEAWDGTLGGIALPDGGYRYLIRYSLPDGSSQEHAGIVILVR